MSEAQSIFKKIKNTLLDLQQADFQSYHQHLAKLGRLLQHDDLKVYNQELTSGLDLDAFLASGESSKSSMVGSAKLPWPDDDLKTMGLQLLLVLKFSSDPEAISHFGRTYYWTGSNKIISAVHAVVGQLIIPFFRDYQEYVESRGNVSPELIIPLTNKVFIVHGHDTGAREEVARFLMKIGFEPIILNEQANKGMSVIEKIEAYSDVGFAVVLLTPDDLGKAKGDSELEPRARQNVLLELGYFMSKLNRDKVCVLKRGDVSIPTDFAGVVWENMDVAGAWKSSLSRELQAAGHKIDWNRVMG